MDWSWLNLHQNMSISIAVKLCFLASIWSRHLCHSTFFLQNNCTLCAQAGVQSKAMVPLHSFSLWLRYIAQYKKMSLTPRWSIPIFIPSHRIHVGKDLTLLSAFMTHFFVYEWGTLGVYEYRKLPLPRLQVFTGVSWKSRSQTLRFLSPQC